MMQHHMYWCVSTTLSFCLRVMTSHFSDRNGVPKTPLFMFCERKRNNAFKFNISLYVYISFLHLYLFLFFFLNSYYFDLLYLEFILLATLLILFHQFLLTSHRLPSWKSFVISKHAHTLTHTFCAVQGNGRLFLDYLPEWCQQRKNRCQRHSS